MRSGEVHRLPLTAANGFTPDLDGIPSEIKRRAKLLVLNYPNSPTGAVATTDFYKRVIDWALTNRVVVVQDAAHVLLTYQGERTEGTDRRGSEPIAREREHTGSYGGEGGEPRTSSDNREPPEPTGR